MFIQHRYNLSIIGSVVIILLFSLPSNIIAAQSATPVATDEASVTITATVTQRATTTAQADKTTMPTVTQTATETRESDSQERTITFEELGYTNIPVRGGFGTSQIYLPFNLMVEGSEDATLALDIESSPLVRVPSSLTIFVNNQPLSSINLTGLPQTLIFDIPAEMIQWPGMSIQFQAYLRVTTDECELSNIPGQWLNIGGESTITLRTKHVDALPQLDDLQQLLFTSDVVDGMHDTVLVIPDNPDQTTVTTAIRVAAGLGQLNSNNYYTLTTVQIADLSAEYLESANLIFVGLPQDHQLIESLDDHLTTYSDGEFYIDENTLLPASEGVLEVTQSVWDAERYVLVVSGNGEEGLEKAGEAFVHRSTLEYMDGNYVFISEPLPTDTQPLAPAWTEDETTLEQLGFGSRIIRGTGINNEYYTITRAPGAVFDRGGQFILRGSASSVIDNDESYVAVFLNESPIGTYSMGDFIDNGALVFQIPTAIDRAGFKQQMNMRIEVSNQIAQEPCQSIDRDNAWTQIDSLSSFLVQNLSLPLPDLQAFPAPFVNAGDSDAIYFIVPDNFESYHIDGATQLAYMLGYYSPDEIDISMLTESEFSKDVYDGNHIFLLNIDEQVDLNAFFADVVVEEAPESDVSTPTTEVSEATLAPTPTTTPIPQFFSNRELSLINVSLYKSLEQPFGLIYTESNPANSEQVVLFLMSETEAGFHSIIDALTQYIPPVNIYGKVAIVQPDQAPYLLFREDDAIKYVEAQVDGVEATPEPEVETQEDAPAAISTDNAAFLIIVIPIAVSILLIILIWLLRRGRWGEDE